MDELIKAFANDVKVIGERRSKLTPFSNMEVGLYGKETMAKVALGRTLLISQGDDLPNTDRAISAAEEYLMESVYVELQLIRGHGKGRGQ